MTNTTRSNAARFALAMTLASALAGNTGCALVKINVPDTLNVNANGTGKVDIDSRFGLQPILPPPAATGPTAPTDPTQPANPVILPDPFQPANPTPPAPVLGPGPTLSDSERERRFAPCIGKARARIEAATRLVSRVRSELILHDEAFLASLLDALANVVECADHVWENGRIAMQALGRPDQARAALSADGLDMAALTLQYELTRSSKPSTRARFETASNRFDAMNSRGPGVILGDEYLIGALENSIVKLDEALRNPVFQGLGQTVRPLAVPSEERIAAGR